MDLLILASERRPLPNSNQFTMSNRIAATILDMMHGSLVIMILSVTKVEATPFHLKACVAILHLTLSLAVDEVPRALILGLTLKIVGAVPRRGNKRSSLNLMHNLMLLRCLHSIPLLFPQRRRKSLLPKRKGARG